MKIVITSGYPTSQHAISLLFQLKKKGFEIPCLIETSLLSIKRIRREIRHLGIKRLLNKATERILKKSSQEQNKELKYIKKYNIDRGINFKTTKSICNALKIKKKVVNNLNDDSSIRLLKSVAPDLVIYAGGGILREKFIEIPRIGVLNAHGGPLPFFRGMNASEWAIFFGIKPHVTIHFIDTGVDTGPIISRVPFEIDEEDDINSIRGKATVAGVKGLIDTVEKIKKGVYDLQYQNKEDGVQFFRMSSKLLSITELKLKQGNLVEYDPKVNLSNKGA